MAEFLDTINAYITSLSRNEWIALSIGIVGLLLLIWGIILFFL